MGKAEEYRRTLRTLGVSDWDSYLLAESGLPGPRANLELIQVVADEGDEAQFVRWLALTPDHTPPGTPDEYLPVCGAVGIGRLLAAGETKWLEPLRRHASDPRWRVREGVAMALQRLGERDMQTLLTTMEPWSKGSPLEQRAAAAALCEPRLLKDKAQAARVLRILDGITAAMVRTGDRKSEDFKVLRKAMGYCWSVAAAAAPQEGKRHMEKWFASVDKDVLWVMRENLKKNRLLLMDRAWVERWQAGCSSC